MNKTKDGQVYLDIKDQILNFEFNLKNDLDALKICLGCSSRLNTSDENNSEKIIDLINETIEKIENEIELYRIERKKLDSSKFNEDLIKNFDMLRIRYNKLSLQIEKVFIASPSLQKISANLPRRKETHIPLSLRYKNASSENFNNYDKENERTKENFINKTQTNYYSKKDNNNIPIPLGRNLKEKTLDYESKEFIKQELMTLKNLMIELKQIMEIHNHEEIEIEISKLRNENHKLIADCKSFKRDNTEIMHILHGLSKQTQKINDDNENLAKEISKFKKTSFTKIETEQSKYEEEKPRRIILSEANLKEKNEMISSWAVRKLPKN